MTSGTSPSARSLLSRELSDIIIDWRVRPMSLEDALTVGSISQNATVSNPAFSRPMLNPPIPLNKSNTFTTHLIPLHLKKSGRRGRELERPRRPFLCYRLDELVIVIGRHSDALSEEEVTSLGASVFPISASSAGRSINLRILSVGTCVALANFRRRRRRIRQSPPDCRMGSWLPNLCRAFG